MKALSISTPWPSAIERHNKRVENRPRWAPYPHLLRQAERVVGQELAIHSSKTHDKEGEEYIYDLTGLHYTSKDIARGAITSVVKVTGLLLPGDPCPEGQEDWYFGSVALVLGNVRVLPRPVPMRGGLGFLTMPSDVLDEVKKQLESRDA